MPDEHARIDMVIKLGGALLRPPECLDIALAAIDALPANERILIVPGGGPFADVIRELDDRISLGVDAAHWAAIRGMDAYGEIVASRLPRASLVDDPADLPNIFERGYRPVLSPTRWLRIADPLPHGWDVTSDSIAAWIAGTLGARRLVLVKRAAGSVADLTDRNFAAARPLGISVDIADATDAAHIRNVFATRQAERGSAPVVEP